MWRENWSPGIAEGNFDQRKPAGASISDLEALGWTHVECVSDFCGNHKSPGAWADLMQRPDGSQVVKLGGGWEYYAANPPEYVDAEDPHFRPFLDACAKFVDFEYAKTHWSK